MLVERNIVEAVEDILEGCVVVGFVPVEVGDEILLRKINISDSIKENLYDALENYEGLFVEADLTNKEESVEEAVEQSEGIADTGEEPETEIQEEQKQEPYDEELAALQQAVDAKTQPELKGYPLEVIRKMYIDDGKSAAKIAEEINVSLKRVRKFLTDNQIKRKA